MNGLNKTISSLKHALIHFPCVFLLLFVYLLFIPRVISYDHTWAIPEILYLEGSAFQTGATLNVHDLKNGLNYNNFESHVPRITRPWSSYAQILDAKFRAWLWHYTLPHPSLSLTWLFSLVLSPLLLYLLLRNRGLEINIAAAAAAFYLLTPTNLSHVTELFRPAKPMADFAIIFCLYGASWLETRFLQHHRAVPWMAFLGFWIISALSFYWDETALLIFPAVLVLFPRLLTHRKSYLFLWLLLPAITLLAYFVLIPQLTALAGYPPPDLSQYLLVQKGLHLTASLQKEWILLPLNAKNLVLGTMGIILPDAWLAPLGIKVLLGLALLAWAILLFHIRTSARHFGGLLLFLVGLVGLFNHLMFVQWSSAWGAFWYGGFWAIFFTIWLFSLLNKAAISRHLLVICLVFIFLNMFQSFIAVNTVYKEGHYYPYNMNTIGKYFRGQDRFFKEKDAPRFSTQEIKENISMYWLAKKAGLTKKDSYCLPSELYWLVIELDPDHKPPPLWKQLLWKHERKDFIETLTASDRCNPAP